MMSTSSCVKEAPPPLVSDREQQCGCSLRLEGTSHPGTVQMLTGQSSSVFICKRVHSCFLKQWLKTGLKKYSFEYGMHDRILSWVVYFSF